MTDATREALIRAGLTSPDGTVVHAATNDVIAVLQQPEAADMRKALEIAHGKFCKIAGTEMWTDSCLDGWRRSPEALREYAEMAAKEIDQALSREGTKSEGGK